MSRHQRNMNANKFASNLLFSTLGFAGILTWLMATQPSPFGEFHENIKQMTAPNTDSVETIQEPVPQERMPIGKFINADSLDLD